MVGVGIEIMVDYTTRSKKAEKRKKRKTKKKKSRAMIQRTKRDSIDGRKTER